MNIRKPWNLLALVAALALLLPAFVWAAYPAEVARTGQTKCYADNGTEKSCASTGQDGALQAGVAWPNPRFTDRADGTVSDNLTGLVWSKNANLPSGAVTWQAALDYVAGMNDGTHPNFGYTDWRLPNVNELESLVHAGVYNPALPANPFTGVRSKYYWSSTSYAYDTYYAWIVDLNLGRVGIGDKEGYYYVWPVRSGQCVSLDNSIICLPKTGQTSCYNTAGDTITCMGTGQDGDLQKGVDWPDPRFTVNGDAVTDNLTGLVWAKNANLMVTRDPTFDADSTANDGMVTWQHALNYVAKLNSENYLNHTDWRLPNTRELRSLADYELFNPALPTGHPFTQVQSGYYWSSTSDAYDTGSAWLVGMYYSYVYDDGKATDYYVWPVRSGQCGSLDNSTTTTSVGSTTSVPITTTTVITTTSIISSTTTTSGGGSTTTTTPGGVTTTTSVSSGSTTTTSIAATTTTTTTGGGCPAKKVLGADNPKLENLRNFRDSRLTNSSVGRKVIQIYYNNSDSINAVLERSPALRSATRRVLEVIAPMVGRD
jgi:hypothetical protein